VIRTHQRTSEFLDGVRRRRREIVSPEGVPLTVELAEYTERAMAFFLDLCFSFGAALLLYLPLLFVNFHDAGGKLLTGILMFITFLARNAYFLHFELAWQGATPGKRIAGLRVVDRKGGPLLPSAVIARNLTRELEMFMPIGIILVLSVGGWMIALGGLWVLLLALLPLFNRDKMRAGDFIGGTIVIALPKSALREDIAAAEFHYTFTERQLSAYGAFELQVLEELLRRPLTHESVKVLRDVGDKIRNKIGWKEEILPDREVLFLKDFYTAERAFLEREQLFGHARPDKNHLPAARTA
jgi:uncharacterized RDD family membrane protein YckC